MRSAAGSLILAALLLPAGVGRLAAQAPADPLVAGALAAAPPDLREGAGVMVWEGERTRTLRKSSNGLLCLADRPGDARFSTACYQEGLEPFMARGRELRAAGKTRAEIDSIRLADIGAKRYTLPPAVLYNLAGSADSLGADGVPRDAQRWYVVYMPYATPETSGLSLQPDAAGVPWLMYPGKPWAHAMITPAEVHDPRHALRGGLRHRPRPRHHVLPRHAAASTHLLR